MTTPQLVPPPTNAGSPAMGPALRPGAIPPRPLTTSAREYLEKMGAHPQLYEEACEFANRVWFEPAATLGISEFLLASRDMYLPNLEELTSSIKKAGQFFWTSLAGNFHRYEGLPFAVLSGLLRTTAVFTDQFLCTVRSRLWGGRSIVHHPWGTVRLETRLGSQGDITIHLGGRKLSECVIDYRRLGLPKNYATATSREELEVTMAPHLAHFTEFFGGLPQRVITARGQR